MPSGGGRRRGSGAFESLGRRLPIVLGVVMLLLVILWVAGVVNEREQDRSVAEEVDLALSRAGYPQLLVEEEAGALVVSGSLDEADDRIAVLAVTASVRGVEEVVDRLEAPEPQTEVPTGPGGAPSSAADLQLQASLAALLARDPIRFTSASPQILPESMVTLDQAAELLATLPSARIEVAGHTDADGEEEANLELSQLRAQAVLDALVDRGVAADRLTAVGFGEQFPIADNTSGEGKARNRRIEMHVLPAGTSSAPTDDEAAPTTSG
jgi:outer membrane protein OmpA-like peptidoglycan-associated protein